MYFTPDYSFTTKISIADQLKDVDRIVPKIDKNSFDFTGWLDKLNNTDKKVKQGIITWQEYHDGLKEGDKWIAKWGQETQGQIRTQEGMIAANESARASIIEYNNGLKQTTIDAKASKIALEGLKMVGNMFLSWAITKIITVAIEKISNLATASKKASEAAQGFSDSIKSAFSDISSNTTTLSKLTDEYNKLSEGVSASGENISLSTSEYDRYKEIVGQISEIMPGLTTYFNAQGEAIGFTQGKLEDLNKEYEKYIKNKANEFLVNGDENGNTVQDIIDDNKYNKQFGFFENIWNSLKNQVGIYNTDNLPVEVMIGYFEDLSDVAKNSTDDVKKYLKNLTYDINTLGSIEMTEDNRAKLIMKEWIENQFGKKIKDLTEDDLNKLQQYIQSKINTMQGSLESTMSQNRQLLLMNMYNSDEFWKLGEDAKTDISTFFSSIDYNTWEKLGKETPEQISTFVDSIIDAIETNKDGFKDAWDELFKLDENSLSFDEYKEKIKNIIDSICNVLGIDESDGRNFVITLGFDIDTSQAQVDALRKKLGVTNWAVTVDTNDDEINKWITSLNATERDLALSDEFQKYINKQKEGLDDAELSAQNYIDALEEMKNAQHSASNETALSFSLSDDQSKLIDDYQSNLSKLQKALEQIRDGSWETSSFTDLVQDFNELQGESDNLEQAIIDLIDKLQSDLYKSFGTSLPDDLRTSLNAATNAAKGLTMSLNDAFSNVQKSYKALHDFKDAMSNDGLTDSILSSVSGLSTELNNLVAGFYAGTISSDKLYAALKDHYNNDLKNYSEALIKKNELNVEFCDSLGLNSSEVTNQFNKDYGIDLENCKTYNQKKLQIEQETLGKLSRMWATYYDAESMAYNEKWKELEEAVKRNDPTAGAEYYAIKEQIDKYEEAVNALNKIAYNGIESSFSGISNILDKNGSSSSSKNKNTFDYVANSINNLNNTIDKLETKLNNTSHYIKQKYYLNKLIDAASELEEAYHSASIAYEEHYRKEIKGLTETQIADIESNKKFSVDEYGQDLYDKLTKAQSAYQQWQKSIIDWNKEK